jgi:plasmid maintenance system antidote protein VapI
MHPHLGKLIAAKLKEKKINKNRFAKLINTSRQNVQTILQRESLDTKLLDEIGKAIDFNFFEVLASNKVYESKDKKLIEKLKDGIEKLNSLVKNK